ncbi:MAG: nucleotidyltransferase family protein [Alphaproteobacteria bacterium]|uniref:Nucleotidyltransferase family protein n=1 Tax=Candidatus Nitrobium versatile TaxID=2884831 RepID=A0A953J4E4_9BACT|nr:nucleotidyltransferase family protein [Candidatus Nitrobium versatile]
MEFKAVLSQLLAAFREHNIRYALMGGFAMGLWGGARSTVDLDFLVSREDIEKVDAIMRGLGYECRYKSDNVSQYVSPLRVFGEIDFLHAFREASMEMLGRAEEKIIFGGELAVRTLIPEDLIGLKLQAIRNNPKRRETDMADIKVLLLLRGDSVDWPLIERYCELLDMRVVCEELKRSGE